MKEGKSRKDVVVILNGISLKKKVFYHDFYPALAEVCNVEVRETLSKHDAISLASKAADEYADLIVAAGGDGTLNQVVNGVLHGRESYSRLPALGMIPIGSGNDFARTVNIKPKPQHLISLIQAFKPKPIDVGLIRFTPFDSKTDSITEKYFVNVADVGMGPEVVRRVNDSARPFGHAVAYYKSILATFLTYKPMVVTAKTDDWIWTGKMRTLAIGNGKCYGHGLHIAPNAKPDDRIFNVFICGNVSVLDFIRYTDSLKKGRHIRIPEIQYKETTDIQITSEKPCVIEGDGEIFGKLPAKIKLIQKQLDFLI
jgi:diacylglycerol kinase (ATP)